MTLTRLQIGFQLKSNKCKRSVIQTERFLFFSRIYVALLRLVLTFVE